MAVLAWSTTQVGGAMILRTSCEVLVFRLEVAILDCAGTIFVYSAPKPPSLRISSGSSSRSSRTSRASMRTPNRTFRASQSAQIRISRPGRTSLF